MDRPMTLVNRSISHCSDSSSSSQSYSVSTLGSASTYYMKKNHKKNSLVVSHSNRDNSVLKKSLQTVKKRMRKCKSSHDRMSSRSLHISDSDLRNAQFHTNRMGLDRQLSISRWMADNEQSGKIRRAVSSHGALSSHERPEVFIESLQQQQHNCYITPSSMENAPFRLFQKAASQRTLSKPVRKRSSGPEGILQDMLMTLSNHRNNNNNNNNNTKRDPWKVSNSTTASNSTNHTEEIANLNDDIEVEDSVIDDSVVEFHEDNPEEDTNSTTPLMDSSQGSEPALWLQKPSRWDALSPSRENQEKCMLPPDKLLSRASSCKEMPLFSLPPPPPFSPSTTCCEGGKIPSKPLRATSNHLLQKCTNKGQIPPTEAASAALAIATDMDEESFSDEEVQLNDVVHAAQKYCSSNNTDAATATSHSGNSSSHWGDDYSEDISVDGVSMLSVSVSNTTFTTMTGTNHSMLANNATSSSATGSLAAYMKWAKQTQQGQAPPRVRTDSSQKDLSCNSFAEDDTFAEDSFDPSSPQQFSKIAALRACSSSDHHPVMALSKREASIVPPCMPKRSVSNHEKLDVAPPMTPKSSQQRRSQSPPTTNEAFRSVSSPTGGRLKQLMDAANKPKMTASRLGLAATPKQRFRRRVTMDHTPSTPTTTNTTPSLARRRASLDHSLLEPSRQRKHHQQQQQQQLCQTPKQRQTSLTSTITKTPRTSPSLSRNRKRLNSHDDAIGVDLQ